MKNKKTGGVIAVIVGLVLAILLADYIAKPDNVALSFDPVESFKTYFFSLVFTVGFFGWILGIVLLALYIMALYIAGTKIQSLYLSKR